MYKNDPEIQKFLESAKAETAASDDPGLMPFEEFWSDKYSAGDTNFSVPAFLSDVSMLQVHNQVTYYKELTSYRKGISSLVLPVKKVIRKAVAFLFLPIIAEQNEINLSNARVAMHLRSFINRNNCARTELSAKEQLLSAKLAAQQEEIKLLTEQVEQLRDRLDQIERGETE